MMKFTIALVAVSLLVVTANCQSHSWSKGTLNPGDRLMDSFATWNDGKPGVALSVLLTLPKYKPFFPEEITFINVTDGYDNGEGGYVTLLGGGVGFKNSTFHLESQIGKGYSFVFDIYGKGN